MNTIKKALKELTIFTIGMLGIALWTSVLFGLISLALVIVTSLK